jgi:hypothetical protein
VVDEVPVSSKNDIQAILTLDKKIHRLCGISITEYRKGAIHASY